MTKSLPDPPSGCYAVNQDLSFEDALLYTAHLLNSASATALDCRDHLQDHDRAKIRPYGTCWKSPKPWSTAR